ncbi:MAG TPA: M48 family metalloprotease [Leptolyngbyaceae cyanobacterium]
MAKSSEQFSSSQPPEHLLAEAKALLQQGLEAAKQKAYPEAIAAFQKLQSSKTPAPYRLQGKMGLIRTYWQTGAQQEALTLCAPLTRHPNEQVKRWAEKMLATIQADLPADQEARSHQTTSSATKTSSVTTPEEAERSYAHDLSGFTPLTSTPSAKQAVPPSTPPLSTSSPLSSTSPSPPKTTPTPKVRPTVPQNSDSFQAASPLNNAEGIPTTSLFHYQQLNGGPIELTPSTVEVSPSPEPSFPVEEKLSENKSDSTQAPKATTFRPLPPLNPIKLWMVGVLTALAVFWLIHWLVQRTENFMNWGFQRLHQVIPAVPNLWFDRSFTVPIAVGLIGLTLASPWLLDYVLRWLYGQKSLSIQSFKLQKPEAMRTMRRFCQQQGWPLPDLRLLPSQAPLCFSYGWRPQNLRLVLSQGLLNQLEDAELATLCAYEMGHLRYWDVPLMSGLGTLLLLIHQGYWQIAQWGNRQTLPGLRGVTAVLSSLLYGVFWLLRKAGLWFSRLRSEYCDRIAIEVTQNPEAYSRSLLKLTQGIAVHIEEEGYTPPLLEGLDLLTPLSQQLALSPGSCLSESNLAELTTWDRQNPYRHWLVANLPQPLLGTRLALLQRYGANLDLEASMPPSTPRSRGAGSPTRFSLPTLLLQGAPIFGLLLGLAIAMVLWFLGGVVNAFDWWFLSWLYQDISILKASAFLGFGIGLLLRINRLFPDIRTSTARPNPSVESLLNQPMGLPIDGQPVQLQGVLIGRPGITNWLCQDVLLKTSSGLMRLHISSPLGPIGNFFSTAAHPETWKDQSVTVSGWVRRGATLWLDLERCQIGGKVLALANHPLWTTLLSLAACLWGVKILFKGY